MDWFPLWNSLRIALFSVLPPILVFAIFQKYISNNNANAGVKG